ncbi:MAG: HAMP domain-containing histidine kinase [Verrucomicrobiota bacterium]|nr:HAMP domain-containing histidine kinase [Verrucomicrobiota bacterium]
MDAVEPSTSNFASRLMATTTRLTDAFLAPVRLPTPEVGRRARLIVRFGFLGFVFGPAYAVFYLAIGHYWGAGIIAVCSLGFVATPFLLRATGRLQVAGNFLTATMTLGFTALCGVEGGLRGHAVAWLASIPLCALLVSGTKSARFWVLVCFAVSAAAITAEIAEIKVPFTYDPAWHGLVNSAGYAGLILFMFALGMIFEHGRERAFTKMQDALGKLVESNEKLVVLNKEKTEFLGIASHDLKNPLTTIITYAQILEEKPDPADIPLVSRSIYAAGTRMRDLIVNLLEANAVEEGRFSCKIERCEINALVAESIAHNQLSATRKDIVLSSEAAPERWIKADKSTTVQILDNLVSNAVKYSPFKTTVRVQSASENGEVMIAVRDEGPGLSDEDKTKLFGKFTRLSARPTGGESSTGLGLSIVKRLAEAMSGSVECRSVLGSGATFILRLPAWPSESSQN